MSSTIRRPRERGQVLAVFAFGLVGILAVAALVFDVGQNLFDRRKAQDAADAAALAGARFMIESASGCKTNPNRTNCKSAVDAAEAIATRHGFAPSQITINVPPDNTSQFGGARGHIQVSISTNRQSFFAGVLGLTSFNVGASAVAANTDGYSLPYSFLALDPTSCGAGTVGGNGTITVGGTVQVNSSCPNGAFALNGGGTQSVSVTGPSCAVVGDEKTNGTSTLNCPLTEGAPGVPDPLSTLGVNLSTIPDAGPIDVLAPSSYTLKNNDLKGCPGRPDAGAKLAPAKCQINLLGSGPLTTLVLHPGVYWGGIDITGPGGGNTLNVYMLPGIYVLAGGGMSPTQNNNGTFNLITVNSVGTIPTWGGGILIYNTDDPFTCPQTGAGCIGAISVTGGSGALQLKPFQFDPYKNLLLYQDRDASSQPDIKIAGQGAFNVEGTIYAPKAGVLISGSGSGIAAQVISYDSQIVGNGGIAVTYNADGVFKLKGAGLVE